MGDYYFLKPAAAGKRTMKKKKTGKIHVSLSYKLFGAFFLIMALVVGAMFLARYIFTLNFHHYINQVELERLESLVPVLQEKFLENGGWSFISKDPVKWAASLEEFADMTKRPLPPPPSDSNTEKDSKDRQSRLLLLDETELPILGIPEPGDKSKLFPITVEDKQVGWLGIKARKPFKGGPPAALLERQAQHLTILGILVIGITALIAVFFSRSLLQPIRQLIQGTRALANREFSVRISPSGNDELGKLAENFNVMATTLEEYETLRKKWLTDISHELRTPLAILRGELEAMQDGIREMTPSSITSLHGEVLRITKLVEDIHLLSLTESDSLAMDKKPFLPRNVLEEAVQHFQPLLAQREISLLMMLDDLGSFYLSGDKNRLAQVFTNIMDNSCKYISQGGTLRIKGRIEGDDCVIKFEDSGPGVSEKAMPYLFDRLYREEQSRNRETGGSGLGLAICRHIIEKHDGEIWAEKSSQGGLCIGIRLPVAEERKS